MDRAIDDYRSVEGRQKAAIFMLAIGHELLDGRVADTNTLRFAEFLREVGQVIEQRTTVPDEIDAIVRAFCLAQVVHRVPIGRRRRRSKMIGKEKEVVEIDDRVEIEVARQRRA